MFGSRTIASFRQRMMIAPPPLEIGLSRLKKKHLYEKIANKLGLYLAKLSSN